MFQKNVIEFREACYELFGFSIERIDIIGVGNAYRLRSVYAERQEDFLLFRVCAAPAARASRRAGGPHGHAAGRDAVLQVHPGPD